MYPTLLIRCVRVVNHVIRYEKDIKDLKAELAMHDALSGKSHVQYEPYTDAQRAELNLTLRKYMNEEVEDIEV